MPVRSDGGPEEALSYEMDPQTLATRLKKEAQVCIAFSLSASVKGYRKPRFQFEIVPCSLTLPQVSWQYHTECSPVCLGGLERDPADPQFYSCSPLHIPVLCGWRRVVRSAPGWIGALWKRYGILFSCICTRAHFDESAMVGFSTVRHVDVR